MARLHSIRMELAGMDGVPHGSPQHGYLFVAPLDEHGHIDAVAWSRYRKHCHVTRFWGGDETEHGMLRHVGRGWRFDYRVGGSDDDEPIFNFDRRAIEVGNYISITEHDGVQRLFRIVAVSPVVMADSEGVWSLADGKAKTGAAL